MSIFKYSEMTNKVIKKGINLKLPKGLKTDFLTFGISEISPGESTTEHSHSTGEEFVFVLEGEGSIILDKKKYEIKKDDLIYIKSNQSHQIVNEDKTLLKLIFGVSPPVDFNN
jgi:quercetin dioxygenase-like cupin family protein